MTHLHWSEGCDDVLVPASTGLFFCCMLPLLWESPGHMERPTCREDGGPQSTASPHCWICEWTSFGVFQLRPKHQEQRGHTTVPCTNSCSIKSTSKICGCFISLSFGVINYYAAVVTSILITKIAFEVFLNTSQLGWKTEASFAEKLYCFSHNLLFQFPPWDRFRTVYANLFQVFYFYFWIEIFFLSFF